MPSPIRVLLFLALLAGTGAVAVAPAPAAAEEAVVDVSVFYEALEPHGSWLFVQPYGWVWQPNNVPADWRPYLHGGHWVWADQYGWMWVSEYEWGWAPFHYGRWFFHPLHGWLWVPGPVWAPAWVAWRTGPGYIGWIPLAPETEYRETIVTNVDYASPDYVYWWSFVPTRWFVDPRLSTRVVSMPWNRFLVTRTRDTTRYATVESRVVNRSFEPTLLEQVGVRIPRVTIRESSTRSATRVDGSNVVVFRPRVREGRPSREPRATRLDPARLAERRARVERFFEDQRKAVDSDPPEGVSADEAKKAREEHRKSFEEHAKRVREAAQRKEKEGDGQPPADRSGQPTQPTRPAQPEGPRPPEGDRPREPRPPEEPTEPQPPRKPEPPRRPENPPAPENPDGGEKEKPKEEKPEKPKDDGDDKGKSDEEKEKEEKEKKEKDKKGD